jgi:hypothetical protein
MHEIQDRIEGLLFRRVLCSPYIKEECASRKQRFGAFSQKGSPFIEFGGVVLAIRLEMSRTMSCSFLI